MSNSMLPIVRQLVDADSDRARAQILLACPDSIILKYLEAIATICRRAHFDDGVLFAETRVAALLAVRDEQGLLPQMLAGELEAMRQVFSAFAARPRAAIDIDSG